MQDAIATKSAEPKRPYVEYDKKTERPSIEELEKKGTDVHHPRSRRVRSTSNI